jgi:hypothetical protein
MNKFSFGSYINLRILLNSMKKKKLYLLINLYTYQLPSIPCRENVMMSRKNVVSRILFKIKYIIFQTLIFSDQTRLHYVRTQIVFTPFRWTAKNYNIWFCLFTNYVIRLFNTISFRRCRRTPSRKHSRDCNRTKDTPPFKHNTNKVSRFVPHLISRNFSLKVRSPAEFRKMSLQNVYLVQVVFGKIKCI